MLVLGRHAGVADLQSCVARFSILVVRAIKSGLSFRERVFENRTAACHVARPSGSILLANHRF